MKKHIPQLDYLKSVFIILMILFHLVYIGDTYPYIKKIVYTFHMPIFLILSGYLSNTNKNVKSFIVSWWWIFIPYFIMELGYVILASMLPVREQIGNLDAINVCRRIFVDPVGPYWYLHTLLICRLIHYFVCYFTQSKLDNLAILIIIGICFWGISDNLKLISFSYSMFFLFGVIIKQYNLNFVSLFSPSLWSVVPLIILCHYPDNLLQFNIAGCSIVYLTISFFLWLYSYLPRQIISISEYLGKNTLSLLLFSPIFTMLSRMYQPFFMFESSGICFAFFTLLITVIGCLGITWCMDKLKISPWFFGQEQMLKK